jgi:serine/threonine protein kinase
MAQILAYLHEQEETIIHRDFTPDNMILKADGTIAIIDFGAANFFLGTATGTMIGKQAYIAPEQLRGKANPQSDLYALGGSLFFLLTGEDPEPLAVSQPALVNRQINPELDKLVSALTQMEVEDRLQSARLAVETLKELKRVAHA